MKYRQSITFRKSFEGLPREIQRISIEKFSLFKDNLRHPSLRIHKLGGKTGIWAGHITKGYVFTFRYTTDENGDRICEALNIGKHDIYYM